jgi:hypothetical protein
MPTASERAQRYRIKSQQLRESAQSMISEEPRRDMEWMANRYEALATTVEELEEFRQPKFPDAS